MTSIRCRTWFTETGQIITNQLTMVHGRLTARAVLANAQLPSQSTVHTVTRKRFARMHARKHTHTHTSRNVPSPFFFLFQTFFPLARKMKICPSLTRRVPSDLSCANTLIVAGRCGPVEREEKAAPYFLHKHRNESKILPCNKARA